MNLEKPINKVLDKKAAQAKAEHYCAYQERSQQEVRSKLYEYGLKSYEVEDVISELIQSNFLNEERFAIAYTLGKFRMKQWGRIKIKMGLKSKRVSDKLIVFALGKINAEDYFSTLCHIMSRKAEQVKESDPYKRKHKLIQYGLMRGYESDIIFDALEFSALL
ncbi:regulatory protein RecX [Arcticibacter svalbardensis MN12-7]|uniref:Regulatory protein RecX n=1 Tax=Arcticibacter svalbardensis MN12-7 TaxID=1150600 RepID=R9GVK3_9SPHI|nr:regulatory protein RecX [Arcticibacter svalbardensis]EOR95756.1 regulatory protein RecX [Arcticibacter svalbardensis MN12-7]